VIPGISPIRRALNEHNSIPGLGRMPIFPISRILCESVESEQDNDKGNRDFPSRLRRQFVRLPLWVQNEATVQYAEGFILFFLPTLQRGGQVIVVHSRVPPHHVLGAYYSVRGNSYKSVDLTEAATYHGEFTQLATVYKKAIRSLGRAHLL
jgi:hypothetical protein